MIRNALIAAALGAATLAAQANTVVVNFTSDAFDAGSLLGQTFQGSFSFDDASLTTSTLSLPLTSLNFTLDGQVFTLAQEATHAANVTFSSGNVIGLNASFTGALNIDLNDGFGSPYAFYQTSPVNSGSANLSFSAAAVPEPASWALSLAGALMLGSLARRRSSTR